MSNDHKSYHPVSQRLRALGLEPLPRWWATPDEIAIIKRIVGLHMPTVIRIKDEVRLEDELRNYGRNK
jgi:hypothetical protein